MDTRRTNRTQGPGEKDATAGTEPEILADEPVESLLIPQPAQQPDEWVPSGEGLRVAHSRLAELLYAAATTLEEINRVGLGGAARRDDERRTTAVPAIMAEPRFEFAAIGGVGAEAGAPAQHVGDGGQPTATTSSSRDAYYCYQSAAPRHVLCHQGRTAVAGANQQPSHHRQCDHR
ncbi:unnamed protein product [Lampetra fluviatilis]